MKGLFKDLKPHRKEVVLAPLFKMLEAGFELAVPLVMKHIMDVSIPAGDKREIVLMALLLFGLAAVGLLSAVTAQYFSAKAATGYASTLRNRLFQRIQRLSFTGLDTIGTSTLITRMTSDVNQVQNGLNITLRLFMRSPFIVFGAMIMAFTVDARAAWIFAVVIPVLLAIVFAILFVTMPRYRRVQETLDRVTRSTRENLTGVRVIRAFRLEKSENEKFLETNKVLKGFQTAVGRISAFLNPVTYVVINAGVIAILYVTGTLHTTRGAAVALTNYMSQILVELVKLANLLILMARAAASKKRIDEVLKPRSDDEDAALVQAANGPAKSDASADHAFGTPAVVFDNVSMQYETAGSEALTGISFTLRRGETLGIIGGTGSGKSTLVELLGGYYPAKEGRILIDGKPIGEYDPVTLREKIGYVRQKAVLFSGTVRENLRMGKDHASDEALWEALSAAQAEDVVRKKEGGLDAEVGQDARNFSGGERQRLSIARALARDPEILILDDASSALDFATDAALRQAIAARQKNSAVVIISARTASVMHADRILVLEDGKTVGTGRHEELLETCPVYREIYDSQFH